MGINFGVVGSGSDGGGNGGDAGSDGVQETEDDVPGDPGAGCGEGRDEEGSKDHDHDVILVSSSPHKVTRWSVTPLSTNDRDVEAGPSKGGMAAGSARAGGGSKAGSLHLFSPDRLKMPPSMMTAAAQLLIQSTHTLLDCPNKSLQKTADPSNDEATLECTASFDNEGQMASPQEDDVNSLIDPGDSATQVEREAAVAKIRPSVWAQDAADVKRIRNLDLPHVKHMYLKFKYAYVIWFCCTSVNFSILQLFIVVLTPHTVKKNTIPGVMAKS